ncbi:olfactory receptor 4B1-like [Megalops cyprinoides]|uniref:olfactory receptor 4B1-like n=1 Tax=Megalops cyprinoides TaxID=118141 RepID=UPI001865597A|nr:olfactory receptor 4B1-like [Megalops cyprinoides]
MTYSSNVTVFTLSGLTKGNKYLYFSVALFGYLAMLLVNFTLILTIIQDKSLHEPMYIFLCSLCMNGLFGITGFYPKLLFDILSETHIISYMGCLTQVFVIYFGFMCEFSTLTAMAYDRTVAICQPLEYHSIMTTRTIVKLITFSWLYPFCCGLLSVGPAGMLPLCGTHIDKLYCDNWSVVKLSCVPTTANNVIGFILILSFIAHAVFIVYSYKKLIAACRHSKDDKHKFMQTCVPHLLTLINHSLALLFDTMYSRYGSKDFPMSLRNFMAIEFLIIPPIFNPLIYGFKLTGIRRKILRPCKRHKGKNQLKRKRQI